VKISIKTSFVIMTAIGFALAVFLRPIRIMCENTYTYFSIPDIIIGLTNSFYWAFWLCYKENILAPHSETNICQTIGLVIGLSLQVIIIQAIWYSILFKRER
jgi:hypothetical protein